ncbi:MAG: hypothetical protein EOL88_00565 [Bacteroidia bacterium]|nr:hypothetical protein [Bacteroidia bacterium]
MTKILVEYLKGQDNYVPGDVRAVSPEEYKQLKKDKIVKKTELLEDVYMPDEVERDKLTGRNILGKKYQRGVIDVVVPTKDKKSIASLGVLKKYLKQKKITLEVIERKFSPEVGGFAKACNDGAKLNEGLGEFILFLNDDVELSESGFFYNLLKPFSDSEVGMVGTACSETSWGLNGSVMCIRRELFEMIGGFDETFFFMFEDNDLCENVKRRGYKICVSKAKAKHEGKDSVNTMSEFWRSNYYNGLAYFNLKWKNKERIIGSMIVGNEADRYMSRVIIDLFKRKLIDEIVVVCDNSDTKTIKELKRLKEYYPITIYEHKFKLFGKAENLLRERATQYAISKNPLGIIPIDADEFFDEELNRPAIISLLNSGIAYDFVLAHYWGSEDKVRIDGVFSQQKNIRLFRYCPEQSQKFYDRNLHCGSGPKYAYQNRKETEYILKHFGYVRDEDVKAKKERQLKYDKKMLLENPDLYNRMMKKGEVIDFNKVDFMKIWKR